MAAVQNGQGAVSVLAPRDFFAVRRIKVYHFCGLLLCALELLSRTSGDNNFKAKPHVVAADPKVDGVHACPLQIRTLSSPWRFQALSEHNFQSRLGPLEALVLDGRFQDQGTKE